MKIRIAERELRYRIDTVDIPQLKMDGELITSVSITDSLALICKLQLKDNIEKPHISLEKNTLTLTLPNSITIEWLNDEHVITLYKNYTLNHMGTLLTLEKDLPCKH